MTSLPCVGGPLWALVGERGYVPIKRMFIVIQTQKTYSGRDRGVWSFETIH